MTSTGLDHLFIETHNWGKSVAFWQALGFRLEFETDHHSGQLVAPSGTRIFLNETSRDAPVGLEIYLAVEQPGAQPPQNVRVESDWQVTHWGTQVMTLKDPDGRTVRLQASTPT